MVLCFLAATMEAGLQGPGVPFIFGGRRFYIVWVIELGYRHNGVGNGLRGQLVVWYRSEHAGNDRDRANQQPFSPPT
jgi:hypothetical protein